MTKRTVVCVDSFVDAVDTVRTAGGKLYHFEFHEMFGPTLTDAKGNILKRQPMNANHPFWKPFEVWNQQRIKLRHTLARGRYDPIPLVWEVPRRSRSSGGGAPRGVRTRCSDFGYLLYERFRRNGRG